MPTDVAISVIETLSRLKLIVKQMKIGVSCFHLKESFVDFCAILYEV